jgi:hypothetical protein
MFQVCYRNSRTTWTELTLPRPDKCEADHSQNPSVFALVGDIMEGAMFRSDAGWIAIPDPRSTATDDGVDRGDQTARGSVR